MFDFSRLLSRITEKGLSQRRLAGFLGITANAFTNKIKGRSFFDAKEIDALCKVLCISQTEIGSYFFQKTKKDE